MEYPDEAVEDGRQLLAQILEDIRARAEAGEEISSVKGYEPLSAFGQATSEAIDEDKLHSLVIYGTAPDKWFADIILKDLPRGVPDVLGTPNHMPKATADEAFAEGIELVKAIWLMIQQKKGISRDTAPNKSRFFQLGNLQFTVPGEVIEELAPLVDMIDAESDLMKGAEADLAAAFEALKTAPEGEADKQFDSLPQEMQNRTLAAISLALATGRFRYPEKLPTGIQGD